MGHASHRSGWLFSRFANPGVVQTKVNEMARASASREALTIDDVRALFGRYFLDVLA